VDVAADNKRQGRAHEGTVVVDVQLPQVLRVEAQLDGPAYELCGDLVAVVC
jgi:hypothetical protein